MPRSPVAQAALWMCGALLMLATMAVAGREAGRTIPTAELLTWRSAIGFAVVCLVISTISAAGFAQIRTRRIGLHVLRNMGHFFGQYGWYYAVTLIPLAQVFALEFTSPIWVALVAPFLLGERFTAAGLLAVLLSFLGVLLVVDVFGANFLAAFGEGQIWALLGALGFAANMICTKKLMSTETALCVLFYLTLLQFPMGLFVAGGLPRLPGDIFTAGWVLALSLSGLGAHFCLAQAFRCADATLVVPMDFFRLPLIAVVGAMFYDEPILWNVFVGGALIFLGNYINIRRAR